MTPEARLINAGKALAGLTAKLEERFLVDPETVFSTLNSTSIELSLLGPSVAGRADLLPLVRDCRRELGRAALLIDQRSALLREWQEAAGAGFEGYLHRARARSSMEPFRPARWEA